MSETITLTKRIADILIYLADAPNERLGYLLARKTQNGLQVIEAIFVDSAPDSTSTMSPDDEETLKDYANRYLSLARASQSIAVISSHIHSRPFRTPIRKDDPYWSVKSTEAPGTIIDGRFYATKDGGDDLAFAKENRLYDISHHLFVHPAFGSEGQIMTPEHVQLTPFSYQPNTIGNVNPLTLEVIR